MTAADVGNYHYGYVGRFVNNGEGLDHTTLWKGAGAAEIAKNFFVEYNFLTRIKGVFQFTGTAQYGQIIPYGDNPVDWYWITMGIHDANITKSHIK